MAGSSPFADGLGLDALNPPHITTFVSSVPRRVGEALATLRAAAGDDDGGGADGGAAVLRRAEALVGTIVAELEATIALVEAAGHGSGPAPRRDDVGVGSEAGELLRHLRDLPLAAWGEGDLLAGLRASVGRIAEPLRHLEQLAERDPTR